ncbi:MAG: UvrD-helicase domain-containing protein [Acidobacteriota bacterium]|nr:UvrD-helicase domain-containing protein [Acidobacteriota bacterium]
MTLQQSFEFAPRKPPTERRNLVIEAGAGTGKTTAIVAEVLKLMLEREDLALERVVLMTFTEKAAGEIADRIREALEELQSAVGSRQSAVEDPDESIDDSITSDNGASSYCRLPTADRRLASWPVGSPTPLVTITDPERARSAIAHHLANIDSLRSQTIHSFCQSLLRSFPIEAGLDPQFKIIEGFERSLLYGQLYDAWLDKETRVDPQPEVVREWELLFAHVGYLFQIRDLVLTLFERRDLLLETEYDFGDFDLDVLPKLEEAIVWIRRDSATVKDPAAARVATHLRATPCNASSLLGGSLDNWIEYLQPVAASLRLIDLRYCVPLKEPMVVLRSGDKGDSIYDRLVSHRAALALLALTRRFLAYLDEEKRNLGVVDFDDLLLRTLAVLGDETVLARARAQFDFIFVDEFQDTDRTQARIIDKLARDAGDAYVPGKTIVVGDPKQSIYGFRRADPETYYRMTEDLARGGAERRILGDQFRSDPPLLDVINAMFARLFPEQPMHDPNVFRPAYHALQARAKTRRVMDVHVTLIDAQHNDKSDRFFAEAEAIAEWIQAHRGESPLDLRRFAILFRRLTKIDDYLDTLDRYDIPYVLPPTRLFLDRRAPVDLLAVLRAIAYPFDLGALISAARTPYFALTDVEIAEGVQVATDTQHPWTDFTASIARFGEASRHLTNSQLIDLVVTTCSIERVYDASADGNRHLRHLEHVRAIAFEYDQRLGASVRQFVDEIERRRADPEEMEPSLADESQNAVRILSVHAAKGLEFETVILPDLSFPTTSSEATQLFTVEEPRSIVLSGRAESISANFRFAGDEKLKKISGQREEAEIRRLFYVAVTRAKCDVVFVCNLHDETKNAGFLKCLNDALGTDKRSLAAMWESATPSRHVRETIIGPLAFEKVEVHAAGARTRPRLHDAALEAELAASPIVPLVIASPADVAETYSTAEVAARRAGSRNRNAGILLHRVLELWDGRSDTEPLLRQLAVEAGADSDAVTRVRKRLSTIARSPMLQRIARAETIGREVSVRFVEEGTLVERRIDRILRETNRDLVIDYKSGTPDPQRVARDREQVQRYCRALTAITGHPCAGALWYIDLESDEVVEVGG